MKELYIYPAVFTFEEEGTIGIHFPDLKDVKGSGNNIEEALEKAKNSLENHLYDLGAEGKAFPKASSIKNISLEEKQQFIMVPASINSNLKKRDTRAVKKTLTIPKWLNDEAIKNELNFSSLLKEALIKELGL